MVSDAFKDSLLDQLASRIDSNADSGDLQFLHNLCANIYRRIPPEDMRGRSVEDLDGCLHGLLGHIRHWDGERPKVSILNPSIETDGWESKFTTLMVLCEGVPFCTASVRGELNRRNLRIHTVASTNLQIRRDAEGRLVEVIDTDDAAVSGSSTEALLFFEIGKHSDADELQELHDVIVEILQEVSTVVWDFPLMGERLQQAATAVAGSGCVSRAYRDEAVAFLGWLERDHLVLLGYEYLEVSPGDEIGKVTVRKSDRLGLLRQRSTRGVQDLSEDLQRLTPQQLYLKQLSFSKSRQRSRIHRVAYPDYVEVRVFDESGDVIGQHRFLGLYTSPVYTMDPRLIPILRKKVARVLEVSELDWSDHEGRELLRVLQVFPRDELFQSSIGELSATVNAVNGIQERRQVRLFVRQDVHGKFVNCIAYIPRDNYNTEQRIRIEGILSAAFNADSLEFTSFYSESILVRCYFVLRVDPSVRLDFDTAQLEEQIVQAMLAWQDRLRLRLLEEFGEESGEQHFLEFGSGFPPGYRDDFDPRLALLDIRKILSLQNGKALAMSLYRLVDEGDNNLRLRLYHRGESLPLSDVLPILENLGLRIVTERPYAVRARDRSVYWVQDFSLIYSLSHDIEVTAVKADFEDAFARIWFGEAENDCFNRLLLGTRLNWREIALLRAYARYLRQLNFPYSIEYIAGTMANHMHITADIVELFVARFSPTFIGDATQRESLELQLEQQIVDSLEEVLNLGEDRIIRQFARLVKATVRTNFFQEAANGELKPYFSFKFRPADIPDFPQPVPLYEIYVYSPRVEGVHLRGGKVARGGLRWSDRQEDFRTEVLGLVKAQQVKNAVIVPVGAKGGFVARQLQPDMSRAEVQDEGIACYDLFIRALLDITDNRDGAEVIGPPQVVVKDDEDPYLVVAADKGTASFSDIANGISTEYGFWLGDAFASGGSVGYDHKKMGITARGAWVSVQRHFREMGVDIQSSDFTVVGIGDMAGDVFGNGMLLSPHICLVAAFNHKHIFLDPSPDAAVSCEERSRLFELPRSSWSDYNRQLISSGGGVFDRSAKSIALSLEVKSLLDVDVDVLTPAELISHLLKARVDLLWNGGIGTYVKAAEESNTAVGDKANDTVRVDASDLRCRVVGEGGNLGLTQLARVEYCLAGGRCNTDFIDNVGGVDCSDHEVNIKIVLNAVAKRGDITMKHRDALLAEMTDSVSALVLKNNYRQTQAISLAEYQAEERAGEYLRFIQNFEESGRLDRALEFIPSDEELQERRLKGEMLTRPELSLLISYSKAAIKEQLIDANLERDPYLSNAATSAFPQTLVDLYPDDIQEHRLHREIVATQIANDIINRMGLNFILRQQKASGAAVADVARAYAAVLEIFQLRSLWEEVEALDNTVATGVQMEMMLNLVRLVKRATRWVLRNRRRELVPSDVVAQFSNGLQTLREIFPEALRGSAAEQYQNIYEHYLAAGAGQSLATAVAGTYHSYKALGIIQAAEESGSPLLDVASLYFLIGERLGLDWFSGQIQSVKVDNEWQALARDTYLEDLEWQQRTLAIGALRHLCEDGNLLSCMESWEQQESLLMNRWHAMRAELRAVPSPDFAMLAVANRELLDLAQSSIRAGAEASA